MSRLGTTNTVFQFLLVFCLVLTFAGVADYRWFVALLVALVFSTVAQFLASLFQVRRERRDQ